MAKTNLEEESVPEGVAEAEDKVLLGVLGHGLHDAVLHPHSVLGDAVVVNARPAISLVEEQRAACERHKQHVQMSCSPSVLRLS